MTNRQDTDTYVYLDCRVCGGRIFQPFSRFSGPVAFTHHRPHRTESCRLIVYPDQLGDDHRVYPLAPDESYEEALEGLLAEVA